MGGRFGTLSEFRRRVAYAALALLTLTGFLALVPSTASAAGPWFVSPTGGTTSACPGTAASPCATVTLVIAKAGFTDGDTINVAAGTYTDKPLFAAAKGATIIGAGAGSTIFDGQANSFAVGALTGAGKTLNINNVTMRNGKPANGLGGGLAFAGTGTVNVSGSAITNNVGTTGGGIYAGGKLNLTNTDVTSNTGTSGAGIYIPAGGTVTVTGGSISSNTATALAALQALGGGVSVATATSSLTLSGVTVNNNVANGGAFANAGDGGGVFNNGNLTITDNAGTLSTFSGNRAISTGSGLNSFGGGVYSQGAGTFKLTNTTITGGLPPGGFVNATFGGGIATGSVGTLTNVTLDGNVASDTGGLFTSVSQTIVGSTIKNNSATHTSLGFGGGILVQPPANGTATVSVSNTKVTANTAALVGGGIALLKGATVNIISGSNIDGNTAPAGGGIASSGVLSVNGSTVSGNHSSFLGGGIFSGSSTATDTPQLTLTNATIDGNDAASGAGGIVVGGNVSDHAAPSTVTATGGEINGNSALGGAGVTIGETGTGTFDGTSISGNTATDLLGGGVLNAGTLTLRHVTLDSNHAPAGSNNLGWGGAIYSGTNNAGVPTKLTVASSTLSNNTAADGAAVFASSKAGNVNATTIDDSTITGNANSGSGNDPFAESVAQGGTLTISRSTITGNTTGSTLVSGGLGLADPSLVNISGTILSGNENGSCSNNGGNPADGGYNLTDPGDTSCGLSAATDVSAAPQLGALASNGGPTKTQLPGPASPALDRIPAGTATGVNDAVSGNAITLCASSSKDQRDIARPQGAKCDIGSVEANQTIPVIDTTSPSSGLHSIDYSVTNMGTPVVFTATGSPQATLSTGSALPSGVTLHDNGDGTATLSGTPAAGTGGDYPITVDAHNEAGTGHYAFDLKVHQAPTIGGPASDTYTVGQADGLAGPDVFSTATGFPDATLSTNSTLPSGVHFTFDTTTHKATISGTPDAGTGGVYTIVIDGANGTPPDAHFTFTLTVDEAPGIDGPAGGTATVGHAFTSAPPKFTTTGFPAATLTAANLPAGLSLHDNGDGTGQITGTPAVGTGGGPIDVVITASNGVGTDATFHYALTVNEAPTIVGSSSARAVVGFNSDFAWTTTGFPSTFTVTRSGDALPSGMTFSSSPSGSFSINGTPGAGTEGTYNITVTVDNGVAPPAVLHLTLEVAPQLGISTTSLPDGSIGSFYSAPVMAIGGQPPYAFTLDSGALPSGLHLAANGIISGTPTGPTGTSTFTVRVTDTATPDAQSATKQLSITIGKGVTHLDVSPVLIDAVNLLGVKVNIGWVEATLTGGVPGQGIPGQTIVWKAGGTTVCTATTDSSGHAQCAMTVADTLRAILNLGVTGSYAGDATWQPASGSAGIIRL